MSNNHDSRKVLPEDFACVHLDISQREEQLLARTHKEVKSTRGIFRG